MTNYTLLKSPLTHIYIYARKTENVQILFKDVCAKIYGKLLCKNCAIWFLLYKLSKAIKCWNPMNGSRSKYKFSLIKVIYGI